jgi:hypothetical protein
MILFFKNRKNPEIDSKIPGNDCSANFYDKIWIRKKTNTKAESYRTNGLASFSGVYPLAVMTVSHCFVAFHFLGFPT